MIYRNQMGPVTGFHIEKLRDIVKLLKYNEHIHYLADEEDSDYDPNEIMELVGLPSGLYFTIPRRYYSDKLKGIITWSEKFKMYTYRDKDYTKIMQILDKEPPRSEPSPNNRNTNNLTVNTTHAIVTFLRHWEIENYSIYGNKVSVDGDVNIRFEAFSYLPVIFEEVSGNFTVMHTAIETLENCPQFVGGDFNVSNNRLRTLEGGPKGLGKNYDCSHNVLRDLRGSPERVGNFNCSNNIINTLKGGPIYVEGDFDCSYNYLTSFRDGPVSCKGILNCQNNMIHTKEHFPFLVKEINLKNNPINNKH